MQHRRHAEIAGAGFAGLATATALCQRGWTARVHEASPELRDFGAGIFIWENGLRVLQALGAYRDVVEGAYAAPGYEARDALGGLIGRETFLDHYPCRMLTMTRQHLYAAMLAAAERAGVDFRTSSEIAAADPDGVLVGADGARYRADLVVGADGAGSQVRGSLPVQVTRERYAYGVIRLLVPRGPRDVEGADPGNVINFWEQRLRILYVPCSAEDLYLAMMAPRDDPAATAVPVDTRLWADAFPVLSRVIARIGEQGRYDTYETLKLDRMAVGRAVLVGDSAHAMPPTLGQGAGCALMNALGLAVALDQTQDVAAAVQRWERRERPLTEHTQEVSSEYARSRAGSDGRNKWDDRALRTALHVPTGTEHVRFPAPAR